MIFSQFNWFSNHWMESNVCVRMCVWRLQIFFFVFKMLISSHNPQSTRFNSFFFSCNCVLISHLISFSFVLSIYYWICIHNSNGRKNTNRINRILFDCLLACLLTSFCYFAHKICKKTHTHKLNFIACSQIIVCSARYSKKKMNKRVILSSS